MIPLMLEWMMMMTMIMKNNDGFYDVHNIPLLDKAYEPLYEVSKTNLLFVVLLIMNLKVMNGL